MVASGLSLEGRVTLTVKERSTMAVEETLYDVYNLSFSGSGSAEGTIVNPLSSSNVNASGSWVLTGWELAEVGGLKRLWTVLDLEANGTLEMDPIPLTFVLRVQNTTRLRLESDAWRFPLRVGESTSLAGRMNFTEDVRFSFGGLTTPERTLGVAWWNVTYALGASVRIDTPAGAFDTFPIEETTPDGMSTRLFYAPLAGNYARTETRNETSELAKSDLVAYRYQAREPPRFLGLSIDQWAIAAALIATGAAGSLWWWRRRKRGGLQSDVVPRP